MESYPTVKLSTSFLSQAQPQPQPQPQGLHLVDDRDDAPTSESEPLTRISKRPTAPAPSLVIPSGVRVRRSTLPASLHNDVLDCAIASMQVELDPIFDTAQLRVVGHEARSVSETAEDDVRIRRHVRALAATAFVDSRRRGLLFVDISPIDLLDPQLYLPTTPLAHVAESVVLQLRGPMATMDDLAARISVLRFQGFRFAVADIESTPARLSLLADLSTEYLKIDASLTAGITTNPTKRRVLEGLTAMCRLVGTTPIAEGIATVKDRAAVAEAGCALVQGPLRSDERAITVATPKTSGVTHRSPTREAFLKRVGNQRR